jgi:hypothetical protein
MVDLIIRSNIVYSVKVYHTRVTKTLHTVALNRLVLVWRSRSSRDEKQDIHKVHDKCRTLFER